MNPFDNTDHCDCCVAKYPDHDTPVKECLTALYEVPMGHHYDAANFLPF